MSTRKTTLFYSVLIAVASLAVGMVIASRFGMTPPSAAENVTLPPMNSDPLSGPVDATTFRNIAKAQAPTVVNIQTEARRRTRELTEWFGGEQGDDFLRRFFGGQAPQGRGQQRGRPRVEPEPTESAGTGFIIDKAGFILTNNHVVEGADTIRVSLYGAGSTESYAAKVVGRDSLTDSALIQLTEMPATPLQEAKFGDSGQMQPGDWVMAIGNPFRLGHSVTVGVISALGRPFGGVAGREQPMLQTDAAINPGNSGGPLLNIRGEVVGMNTAIFTDQRSGNLGIGFATPINTIRGLLPQLRSGKVVRGVIGVSVLREFSKDDAAALGAAEGGALLTTVNPGGAADRAGLQNGDVVVAFNNTPVRDNEELVSLVVGTKPGTTVPITIVREKQRKTLNVTVDELDLEAEQGGGRAERGQNEPERTETGLGITLEPITPEIARELNVPRGRGGAIVSDVERNSPAANAGIAPNDVILDVNNQPVTSVSQVTRALQGTAQGSTVFLRVWRQTQNGGQTYFIPLRKR
jgi:serine protease Do